MRRSIVILALALVAIGLAIPGAATAVPVDNEPCPVDPETGQCLPPPPDADRDGRSDGNDNCPHHYNPGQEDNDRDGVGNVCDSTPNGSGGGGGSSASNCDGGEGVYLYEHADYGGRCHKVTADEPAPWSWSIGNDAVSSVRIVGAWTVTLFEHGSYGGRSTFLSASSAAPWGWSVGNDSVSSVKARPSWWPDGWYSEDDVPENTITSGASNFSAGASTSSGCRTVTYRRTARSFLFRTVLYRLNLRVYWCWQYPNVTSVTLTCTVTNVDSFTIQASACTKQGSFTPALGSTRGGYYSVGQAKFKNCIFQRGCWREPIATLEFWSYGNGTWQAKGGDR